MSMTPRPGPVELIVQVGVEGFVSETDVGLIDSSIALPALDTCMDEVFILSTCNRIELYAVTEDSAHAKEVFSEILAPLFSKNTPDQRLRHGVAAVEHLSRVAAGLESSVLGEDEILAQVRSAVNTAEAAGTLGPLLSHVAKAAIRTGRRSRHETNIGRGSGSYATSALKTAEKTLGNLRDHPMLLIGAGQMANNIAKMATHRGIHPITVANRTVARAEALATHVGGQAIGLDTVQRETSRHQLIIVAMSGSPGILDGLDFLSDAPVCVCDLSTPSVVADDGLRPNNVEIHRLPEIIRQVDQVVAARRAAIPAVEKIVHEEAHKVVRWLTGRAAAHTIQSLQAYAESIRQRELEKIASQLGELTDTQQAMVDQLTRAIVKSTLHRPMQALHDPAHSERLAEALKNSLGFDSTNQAS